MNKSRFERESSNPRENRKRFSKLTSLVIFGTVVAALVGLGALVFSKSSNTVTAQTKNEQKMDGKKYIATRNFVVDQETGRARKPNEQELKELVETLTVMPTATVWLTMKIVIRTPICVRR